MQAQNKKVIVGLSGGVDSSVSALLLKQAGYEVTGVYMKNWTKDIVGFKCPWQRDLKDAKRVAVKLGIPFEVWDFQKEYRQKVVNYMLEGFKSGITPNPDIMCNQEIKFKLFLDTAKEQGADYIATGHYAKIVDGQLRRPTDESKDQTYFLARMPREALGSVVFPLSDLKKSEVRQIAEKHELVTAHKKDSVGICFVGEVGLEEFLASEIETSPGDLVDDQGWVVGRHKGAILYTIGQRHGLNIGGGLPYYVTSKDMSKNEVYVTTALDNEKLWANQVSLTDLKWLQDERPTEVSVVLRYGQKPVKAKYDNSEITLEKSQRAVAPGQTLVMYEADRVIGSGIISSASP